MDENDPIEPTDLEDSIHSTDPINSIESTGLTSTPPMIDGAHLVQMPLPAPDSLTKLKKKSTLYPSPSSNSNASAFLKLVTADIEKMKFFHKSKSNLDRDERAALDALARVHDIVIKPFDKGGNVVVMGNTQYIEMCQNL